MTPAVCRRLAVFCSLSSIQGETSVRYWLLWIVMVLPTGSGLSAAEPERLRVPITPQWALECWLWEDDYHH